MQINKRTKTINIICVCLVLFAGVIRLIAKPTGLFVYNSLIFTLLTFTIAIWIFQLKKRLLQPDVKRNLISAASIMIFWMAIRTIKYDFLPDKHFTLRYAWYLYYIPMVLIPLLIFLSVLAIGLPHDKPINRKWYLLFIPAVLILLGVLTNDLHQNTFRFSDGLDRWDDSNTTYGFVYYAVMTWIILLFLAIIITVFIRCAVSERKKKIKLPLSILFVGLIYMICYNKFLQNIFLTMPEISCLIFIAFTESLICLHLLPSNDNYGSFWNASSIGAGIMDKDGIIHYKSEKSYPVTPAQVKQAQNKSVLLKNGEISLHSHAIKGGFGYWTRDISEINRLNKELKELGNVTAEENAMLEAENKMKEERIRIEKQNKLYDDMAKGVKKQLEALSDLLESPPIDESAFEKTMKYACILNAYVKRHSNLILLADQGNIIHSEELRRSIIESMEYVQLYGIKMRCSFDTEGNIPAKSVLLIHELFEEILESSIPGADDVLVYLKTSDNSIIMRIVINAPKELIDDTCMNKELTTLGGILEVEFEENTEYVSLTLPKGGNAE